MDDIPSETGENNLRRTCLVEGAIMNRYGGYELVKITELVDYSYGPGFLWFLISGGKTGRKQVLAVRFRITPSLKVYPVTPGPFRAVDVYFKPVKSTLPVYALSGSLTITKFEMGKGIEGVLSVTAERYVMAARFEVI